ncbi:hypothetical protein [Parasphingopyxis sp.]|uniref:hypothetical protein n=1 Tax=Parasphingopyxis sp. TaxID=1920299 RepID=UPI0026247D98|nr:hypothetical protein [Parasphingopyxis sp.]
MIAALLLLQAATPAETPPAYPTNEVLVAFANACSDLSDMNAVSTRVASQGWEQFAPAADSQLGALVSIGQQNVAGGVAGLQYRGTLAGRTLYLALSEAQDGNSIARGCRLYDFTAPAMPDLATLVPWAGRQPSAQSGGVGAAAHSYSWSPSALAEAQNETVITFIPADSPLAATVPASGLALVATQTVPRN